MSKAEEASQQVSDDELDRAADEAMEVSEGESEVAEEATEEEVKEVEESEEAEEELEEEEVEEEVSEEDIEDEAIPAEPEDNAERSKLGRKVQLLEEELAKERADSNKKLAAVLERMDKMIGKDEVVDEEDFVMPETKSDLDDLINSAIEKRESASKVAETQKASQYQTDYVDTVQDLVEDETEEVRAEILKRLGSEEFNIKHSVNGSRDAAKNIKNVIKSLSVKEKKVPLKQEKPRSALGGGGSDKTPAKTLKVPKLDKDAQAFVDAMGMDEKDVAETLNGNAPAYIRP